MRLVFIHGPIACGKLTVARELAALTGFGLFHNHLIVDALLAVFDFGSPEFVRLREEFWLQTFEAAARADRSLIFTFAPEASVRPDFPDRAIRTVEGAGGEVLFAALACAPEIQRARLGEASRAAFGKLTSAAMMEALQAQEANEFPPLPDDGLTLDTGALAPAEAARAIQRHFALPGIG